MKFTHVGKNYKVGDNLKEISEKKLGKLDKYFADDVELRITYSQEGKFAKAEVTILIPGTVLRAEEATDDIKTSIDRVVDSLESQIRKYKTRLQKRYNNGRTIRFENIAEMVGEEKPENEKKIVKVKKFGLKPMDAEEAILQMELISHDFFVFLDSRTDLVKVVYKRKDGNYGILEPDF
ncbi:MAG: ribosome-associated translation inhibitor RaiA [Lagierella massiliensis]|nr:ribosome-associated translation inhibitor RaiA [Lagierella massiliensis]